MTKTEAVDKVLRLAAAQIGYKADAAKHNKYAQFFDNEYPDFYNGKKDGFDFCDIFVDWLFVQSFGFDPGREMLFQPLKSCGAGCSWSARYYKQAGAFYKNPERGDQIFFADEDGPYHTGIIEKVDDEYVYTIEGNVGYDPLPTVRTFKYHKTNPAIYGYGRPDWNVVVEADIDVLKLKGITDFIYTLSYNTLAGKYGVNPERKKRLGRYYDCVQFIVNEYFK